MISKIKPLSIAGFYSHRKTHLLQKSINKEESEVNLVAHFGLNERKRKIWEEKLKRIEDMVQLLRDKPLPIERKLRVSDPMYIYRLFPKQQQAFDFSESCGQDVMVFSKELDSDGRRNYLVTSSQEFWKMYKALVSEERCYYEVIPEGSPCRLYFDLEFKKEMNPQHNGENMVDIFIKCVCHELMRQYNIYCNKRNVVHFDSSTENKFSAHLIFHLPNAVFKDNIHAGRFVEHVCAKIHENLVSCQNDLNSCELSPLKNHENYLTGDKWIDKTSPENTNNIETEILGKGELQELMIKNSKGDEDIFCDRGVYTKNRNFRLFLSTKIGRDSPLVLSKKNIFQPNIGNKKPVYSLSEHLNFSLFLDSLVSHLRLDSDVRILTFDVTSENVSKKPRKKVAAAPVEMGQESPYPEIDQLIKDNICKGAVQGYIRRCLYFKERDLIIYDIGNNRWCENIGRPHKSNHIMMVADLVNRVYYQKCHDPECKKIDFRSPEIPLPFDINLASNLCVINSLDYFDENIDEEILTAVEQLEEQACNPRKSV